MLAVAASGEVSQKPTASAGTSVTIASVEWSRRHHLDRDAVGGTPHCITRPRIPVVDASEITQAGD